MTNHFSKPNLFLIRAKRKILAQTHLLRFLLVAGLLAVVVLFVLTIYRLVVNAGGSYLTFFKSFLFPSSNKVQSYRGRVNLLLMGKSGSGYEAPDLTDTLIFTSISLTEPEVILVSLPRDIWVPSIRAKLNSAYYWGKQKEEGGGVILAKSLVEEIIGASIEYGVVVDFSVFKQVIDTLGGVEVEVKNSFVDERYPLNGRERDECNGDPEYKCRYETLRFVQGKQSMDGEVALKFVRSRNAEGDEGTDLARDARQQTVILAIKEKILSPQVFLNLKTILALKEIAVEAVETDLNPEAFGVIARRLFSGRKNIQPFVLDEKFLEHPPISSRYDNQYVFVPKTGDWTEVQTWLESLY